MTSMPRDPPTSIPELSGVRVLVLDDVAISRTILRQQLSAAGASVTTVGDGASALEHLSDALLNGRPFGLAILNRQIPGIVTLEVARAIHADPTLAGTRLVLLAQAGELDQGKLFAAVLASPVGQAHLVATLSAVLATPPPPDTSAELGGPLVLLAEDSTVNQLVARRMLERLGCRVDVVGDGREAVAVVAIVPYAAVIMDVHMPQMDGLEATAEIRRRESGRLSRIPIVAMTANALEADLERCRAAGMDDFLAKPVRLKELQIVLSRWLKLTELDHAA